MRKKKKVDPSQSENHSSKLILMTRLFITALVLYFAKTALLILFPISDETPISVVAVCFFGILMIGDIFPDNVEVPVPAKILSGFLLVFAYVGVSFTLQAYWNEYPAISEALESAEMELRGILAVIVGACGFAVLYIIGLNMESHTNGPWD